MAPRGSSDATDSRRHREHGRLSARAGVRQVRPAGGHRCAPNVRDHHREPRGEPAGRGLAWHRREFATPTTTTGTDCSESNALRLMRVRFPPPELQLSKSPVDAASERTYCRLLARQPPSVAFPNLPDVTSRMSLEHGVFDIDTGLLSAYSPETLRFYLSYYVRDVLRKRWNVPTISVFCSNSLICRYSLQFCARDLIRTRCQI